MDGFLFLFCMCGADFLVLGFFTLIPEFCFCFCPLCSSSGLVRVLDFFLRASLRNGGFARDELLVVDAVDLTSFEWIVRNMMDCGG